jgi:glycine/D-amino acid oxidase-like deaminating enzyme
MSQQGSIAVIGAGIVGAAVAFAHASEGRRVLLIDRAEPGIAGASFGNVGHVAAELVQPLPSPALLFGFWRELVRFGGPLDLGPRQALSMLPWVHRFARAAFSRAENTRHLAPLIRSSATVWARWLGAIGRSELLCRHGHYEVSLRPDAEARMQAQAQAMAKVDVNTRAVPREELGPLARAAGAETAAALWFPDSGHIIDPLEAVRALAEAAIDRGAEFRRLGVRGLAVRGSAVEIAGEHGAFAVDAVVICAGMGSRPLLESLGASLPLQAARGYHIEVPNHPAFFDAPVVYADAHTVVTPMSGRLRASSFMEFRAASAPADPAKVARLRRDLRRLGYACEPEGPAWVGARPVLPDYLPALGRLRGPAPIFYATGHQHVGLTLAPITGELISDLVAERSPRMPIAAFDLARFNGF